jgi:hypothetical protein
MHYLGLCVHCTDWVDLPVAEVHTGLVPKCGTCGEDLVVFRRRDVVKGKVAGRRIAAPAGLKPAA